MADPAYNERHYVQFKRILRDANLECWHGCGRIATSPDHDPPLTQHTHVRGSGCCVLRPACSTCQSKQGARLRNAKSGSGYSWP